ncbi:dentin sialophosphoprotein [Diaphorina citri]|uniref:Dentin sialophosphoprotein n=1 Tax=Diaphorina citri TaxID=121845 RepID=A0A1S3DJH9_DIACI|nr:dentin sialophosphoprotein [Diaphorina citri]XP_026686404.1 dentin sialophosphoprotein [Diaphorina citri]
MMELNGNEIDTPGDTNTDTSSAPLEILAEFLSLIMKKKYQEAMQHCKTILEYEPQNETVLSFIPLLNEKLKILQEEDTPADNTTGSGDDDRLDNVHDDIDASDVSTSSGTDDAINEGDTSSELSPYDSSGSVSSLSECEDSESEDVRDGSESVRDGSESVRDGSESVEVRDSSGSERSTRSPSLNQSHSSNPDSSRQDVNSNSLDRSNSSKDIQSLDQSNSSKENQSNSSKSDVYFSLDSSSSNPQEGAEDKSSSTSSSTKLGRESINRTLAKTIENIRKKYGIRRNMTSSGTLKNINDLYCAGQN